MVLDSGYSFEVAARHDKAFKGADEPLLPCAWPSPPSCCQPGLCQLRQRHSGRRVQNPAQRFRCALRCHAFAVSDIATVISSLSPHRHRAGRRREPGGPGLPLF